MPYFIIFIVFIRLLSLSIERQFVDMKTILRSLDIVGQYREDETFVRQCGRLFAAKNNLEDSFTYLTQMDAKYQKHFYYLKYSLLSESLQEKLETLGCETKRARYLTAKIRRIKSKGLNENWPKWVSHICLRSHNSQWNQS